MKLNIIESLLEKKIGLDPDAIGKKIVKKAIRRRMDQCRLASPDAYAECLACSNEEWNNLIEELVVPETWFFRNRKVFDYLVRFARDIWFPKHKNGTLRLLSIPCSTGEEPFSITMAFMDAGIRKERFQVDGVDISEEALSRARLGEYGPGSFRGNDLTYRNRYFQHRNDAYQLCSHVKERVRFRTGNVMENRFMAGESYDVIFCRNLLIYMSPEARNQILETMNRLLTETGILFCGHAERQAALDWGFDVVRETGVFACRKRCDRSDGKPPSISRRTIQGKNKIHIPKPVVSKGLFSAKTPGLPDRSSPKASTLPPERKVDLFLTARTLADRGELPKALELCEVFLGEHPAHAEAHFLMGLIHEALGNEEKAEEFFNKAIYLNPNHSEALNHLAFIESQRGNESGAVCLRKRAQRVRDTGGRKGFAQRNKGTKV